MTEIVGACLSQFHDDPDSFELLLAFSDGREFGHLVTRSAAQRIAAEFATEFPALTNTSGDDDETYEIGKRDGYSEAVQQIDQLTGGDGEYRYCTDHDPDRHTPGPAEMIQRIVDRFETLNLLDDATKTGRDQEWGINGTQSGDDEAPVATVRVPIELLRNIWAEQYYGVGGEHGIDDTIAQWNLDQVVDILASAGAIPDLDADPKAVARPQSATVRDEIHAAAKAVVKARHDPYANLSGAIKALEKALHSTQEG